MSSNIFDHYRTVTAPVIETDMMASLVYVDTANQLYYRSWGSEIIYMAVARPSLSALSLSWQAFNLTVASGTT